MADRSEAQAAILVMVALLRQGRLIHAVGLLFLIATLGLAIGLALGGHLGGFVAIILGLALCAGLGEAWFAIRVGLDEELFAALGSGALTLPELDSGLMTLGVKPAEAAGRPLAARCKGAKALLAKQAGLAVLQLLLIMAALLLLAVRVWP